MGISIPKIITIDEFKGSEIYDVALGDDTVAYSDNFILEAISMATMNMDQLSGFQLMKNIDTLEQSDLDYVKFGACKYVNHLLRKGPEYLRGSGASTLGGANFSQTNPDDPYYIPPEVWTALQKVNMLADFVVGNFKTPATATSGFSYTTRGDKFFEDGNFAVTVREGNAWYVRYDRVQSSDNTVKISLGNDVDRKVLNITLNTDGIVSALESNTSFKNIVLSATMKNIDKIIDAVFSQLIKDEGLIASITTSVENIILDDEKFKIVIENAIEKLLTNDSNFLTNVEEKLKGDLVFTTEIGRIMASNESIINAIASNQDLINTISNGVKEQLTGMLKDTFVDLVDTTPIESLGGKSVETAIKDIDTRNEKALYHQYGSNADEKSEFKTHLQRVNGTNFSLANLETGRYIVQFNCVISRGGFERGYIISGMHFIEDETKSYLSNNELSVSTKIEDGGLFVIIHDTKGKIKGSYECFATITRFGS